MKKVLYIGLALCALLFWRDWNRREIIHPPGILVHEPPRQQNLQAAEPLLQGEFRLTPRASFSLRARVLSRENYHWGAESDLSPMDLALGWGVMSDQQVLDRITITQGTRWYFTRYELPAPIPDASIISNSSNMHMVPANSWVRKKLKEIRRGDLVALRGSLVDVGSDSGFTWTTSLSRNDTGNGSCEIFYVEHVNIEKH
ncbi:MAG: hypothetical protein HKN57_01905 [Xanthomonadales bacterium]|nr:hypothetical protein [Gammaproteobacteria bacterium]MBT8053906.1 hypothetical protein [Gammaproteobacteria bacterium]NND55981.1 hypothetical protein [Xanthomonadales bacterium]NNK52042.1 hypothetical protein [Xanthomonadales bacterium]